ncbi:YbaB/EbfC family nucleoid-associated protein [Pilimelia columellifera]|uniref:YbaB/EbfC DNA-binding family protein n=1 Tax=Pilimelia columellifera subsp. columellifera TaxID=706583 RepID=A0ABP6A6G9_9ACTN
MPVEIDESWLDDALERHRQIEKRQAEFAGAAARLEVTVRSADGWVEVRVTAAGDITGIRFTREARGDKLASSVLEAVTAAVDGARWARDKLWRDVFSEFPSLKGVLRGQHDR